MKSGDGVGVYRRAQYVDYVDMHLHASDEPAYCTNLDGLREEMKALMIALCMSQTFTC
jgi:hypothetical protein